MVVGTAEAVPALAALLANEELSHMARYALERIPDPAAAQALREAIPQLAGKLKAGVIGSLGVRKDADSVAALSPLLSDADAVVARAAASRWAISARPRLSQHSRPRKCRPSAKWLSLTRCWPAQNNCWPTTSDRGHEDLQDVPR